MYIYTYYKITDTLYSWLNFHCDHFTNNVRIADICIEVSVSNFVAIFQCLKIISDFYVDFLKIILNILF